MQKPWFNEQTSTAIKTAQDQAEMYQNYLKTVEKLNESKTRLEKTRFSMTDKQRKAFIKEIKNLHKKVVKTEDQLSNRLQLSTQWNLSICELWSTITLRRVLSTHSSYRHRRLLAKRLISIMVSSRTQHRTTSMIVDILNLCANR